MAANAGSLILFCYPILLKHWQYPAHSAYLTSFMAYTHSVSYISPSLELLNSYQSLH